MPRRTHEKICQNCGKVYWGLEGKYFCNDCAKKLKAIRTKQEKICTDCGRVFMGGPKSFRCPDCQRKITDKRKQDCKYYGAARPLGSTDKCAVCGKEYIVEAGAQKYCSAKCKLIGLDRYNKRRMENIEQKKRQKAEMRANQLYVCQYCKRPFSPVILSGMKTASHLYCSNYCRKEQKKIQLCVADIKRGKNRDLQKYIDARNQYREKVAQEKNSMPPTAEVTTVERGENMRKKIDFWDGEKIDIDRLNVENYFSGADALDSFGYYEGDTASDEDKKGVGEIFHEDEYWILENEAGEEVDTVSFVREWTKKEHSGDECPEYGEPERSYWKRVE